MWVGYAALILAVGIALLYMPGSPAALVWPYEWAIAGGWALLGLGFYLWARTVHPGESEAVVLQELTTGHSDIEEPMASPA
jgi:hypothetical protein